MSLLPESASFEERVQDCFLGLRGAGLMLSPLDADLLAEWAESNVPFEVIARGIRKAAERALWDARPGEPALRTLRSCRREVETEIKKYRRRTVGAGPSDGTHDDVGTSDGLDFLQERHKRLRAVLRKIAREHPRLDSTVSLLMDGMLARAPVNLDEADRREEYVTARFLRALPFRERLRVYREAGEHAGDPKLSTPDARRLSRRFHRHALARRALALPAFW